MFKIQTGFKAVLTLALVCAPFVASAAYESPSALVTGLKTSAVPVGYSLEMHAQGAPYYIAGWSNGTVGEKEGVLMMNAKNTVDFAMQTGKVRAKFQFRQNGNNSYILPEEVTGNFNDKVASLVASFKMKKWLSLPTSEVTMWGNMEDTSMLDTLFTMTSVNAKDGSVTYTLVPTEETMAQLQDGLKEMAVSAGHAMPENIDITFALTVTTDAAGAFVSGNFSVVAKNGDLMLSLKATSWRVKGTFVVEAPTEVYSWEEGLFGFGEEGTMHPDWPSWIGKPDFSSDSWMFPTMEEDSDSIIDWGTNTEMQYQTEEDIQNEENMQWQPECNTSELRRGECPQWIAPSPRRQ